MTDETITETLARILERLDKIREELAGEHPALDAKIDLYRAFYKRAAEIDDTIGSRDVADSVVRDTIVGLPEAIELARVEGWIL